MRVFEFVKTEFMRGFTPEEEPPVSEEEEDASDDELASTENASPMDVSHIEVRSLPAPPSRNQLVVMCNLLLWKFHIPFTQVSNTLHVRLPSTQQNQLREYREVWTSGALPISQILAVARQRRGFADYVDEFTSVRMPTGTPRHRAHTTLC